MNQSTASTAKDAAFGSLSVTIFIARLNAGSPSLLNLLRFVVPIAGKKVFEILIKSKIHIGFFAVRNANVDFKRRNIGTIKARDWVNRNAFLNREPKEQRLNGKARDALRDCSSLLVRNGGLNASSPEAVFIEKRKKQNGNEDAARH